MTAMMITDQPEVTEHTRFWLFSEVCSYRTVRRGPRDWDQQISERHRVKYEVDEARYRAAHAEQCPEDIGDFTLPLDDHWWTSTPLISPNYRDYTVRVTRGGFIDWYDPR